MSGQISFCKWHFNQWNIKYLFVKSSFLVARDPYSNTDIKYKDEVVRVAANVPIGIERCVSFSDADRFEPAMIPVTAGKKRPTNALPEVQGTDIIRMNEKNKFIKFFCTIATCNSKHKGAQHRKPTRILNQIVISLSNLTFEITESRF